MRLLYILFGDRNLDSVFANSALGSRVQQSSGGMQLSGRAWQDDLLLSCKAGQELLARVCAWNLEELIDLGGNSDLYFCFSEMLD